MSKRIISTKAAPSAIGPYSQAVWLGETLYLSGQIALDPLSGEFRNSDFTTEAQQIFANIKAVLAAAGGDFADVIKLTIYLIDFADFQTLNALMSDVFPEPYPARTTIAVAALPKGARLEIETIAHIKTAS